MMENFLNRFITGGKVDEEKLEAGFPGFDQYIVITSIMEDEEGARDLLQIDNFERELEQHFEYIRIFTYSKETTYLVSLKNKTAYEEILSGIFTRMPGREGFYLGGASFPYINIKEIKKAYEESRNAMNYCCANFLEGTGIIRFYEDCSRGLEDQLEVCIKDTELIVNTLLTCDAEGVQILLEDIVSKNKGKPYVIQKEMYHYLMNMFYTVINSWNVNPVEQLHVNLIRYISDMKEIYSIKQLHRNVMENYLQLVSILAEDKVELIDDIVEFIKNNYDKQISLQLIAKEFNMSFTYISHYFKKYTGVNFIDFIRNIRVEKAKEILKNENTSINEVAHRTGFDTVNTFIRIFKKLNGITPGEYKSIARVSEYKDSIKTVM